jgi:hypothetical protein
MRGTDPRVALLVEVLDEAYGARGWHGTTLRGALRGLTPRQALWRPSPRRHCVWELILHTAYWKYTVRQRLTGGKRGAFPRTPSNFPRLPARPDTAALKADIALLEAEHQALRAVVAGLGAAELDAPSARGTWRQREMIHGVAAHDVYHTGQIQLLKRLQR